MKIKSIQLTNFKQFENFSVSCRDMNVLTGPNNAGKSSILDALRICKDVVKFASRRKPVLASQPGVGVCATYSLDDSSINIDTTNIVRNYGEDSANIIVKLENNSVLKIALHPSRKTVAFLQTEERPPKSAAQFSALFPLDIIVVPTLAPFEKTEAWVYPDTLKKNEGTRLAARNFRNIWRSKTEAEFLEFNILVQKGWPNVSFRRPNMVPSTGTLDMFYIEDRSPREIYWAGFGFQVWLQMMTHMMRGGRASTLVLDEPDIYLHPDLQRKLTKIIRQSFGQVFLATHSTEIINEVNAGDILSIESRARNARRITNEEGYRHLFGYLGSSENAEFARMARARRIVFFEGDDRRLLRRFAQKISKANILDDPDTVFLKTGGFGQWRRVTDVGWTLDNLFGMQIKICALFDRDYRCSDETQEFLNEMNNKDVLCHVLLRKEIENYALHEPTLVRTMINRASKVGKALDESDCSQIIDEIFAEMHNEVRSNLMGEFVRYQRKIHKQWNESTAISRAMAMFELAWLDRNRRFELVGGKDFLSLLTTKLHEKVGTYITLVQIISEMRVSEVPADLVKLMESMEMFFIEK